MRSMWHSACSTPRRADRRSTTFGGIGFETSLTEPEEPHNRLRIYPDIGSLDPNTVETIMRQLMLAAIVLLIGASSSLAQGHMGSPREQQACTRDAQRFCRKQLGDDGAVQQCLQQHRTKLSKSCQKVFRSHGM